MAWYYAEAISSGAGAGTERRGPLDDAGFEALARAGRLRASTLVWQSGMAEWLPLSAVRPDLIPTDFSATPPPLAFCSVCGQPQPPDDLLPFDGRLICAACKPRFAQAISLGLDLSVPPQHYAGFWIRCGARLIDSILISIVQYAILFALPTSSTWGLAITALIYFLIHPTYEAYLTVHHRATLGKLALGLRIQRLDGTPLTWQRVVGRYFAQLLSQMILGIGYLMVIWDDRKQALHDRVCDTVVVYET